MGAALRAAMASPIALDPADRIPETPSTRHRDYILTDYEPSCDPSGRLHSVSLLRHVLRSQGSLGRLEPLLISVRRFLGEDETVWGLKVRPDGSIGLELYFYNFTSNASPHRKSVTSLTRCLCEHLPIAGTVDEAIPYFMCSVEVTSSSSPASDPAHFRIYVRGERLRDGYDGISYCVGVNGLVQENYYTFYRADAETERAADRLDRSVRGGAAPTRHRLFDRGLLPCHTICYATKRTTDALYFSRVGTGQLSRFIKTHGLRNLGAVLDSHAEDFAHLRWDVGYDFRCDVGSPTAAIVKTGFYGIL